VLERMGTDDTEPAAVRVSSVSLELLPTARHGLGITPKWESETDQGHVKV